MFIKIVLCAKIGIDVRNLEMKETVVKSTCKLVSGKVFSNPGLVASGPAEEIRGSRAVGCRGKERQRESGAKEGSSCSSASLCS